MTTLALEPAKFDKPVPSDPTNEARWWTKRRTMCLDLLMQGKSTVDVATACKRGRDWVWTQRQHPFFKARVAYIQEQQLDLVTTFALGNKTNRVSAINERAREMEAYLAAGNLTERTVHFDKDGNEARVTERFNETAVRELRQTYHAIAEELGQLPRGNDTGTPSIVLIRELNVSIESLG